MYQEHWLTQEERERLITLLLNADIIKCDNRRSLPLKKGGTTDIYINLRNLRNHPAILKEVSSLFAHALRRAGVVRFIEVPDGISCVAGPLSMETGIPYITVRESEKTGRVSKGKLIGEFSRGMKAAIIDDVITDGTSKIYPYEEGLRVGLEINDIFVLVDREQGWQETFEEEGIPLRVRSGMTLHQIRKFLIETGVMQRCAPEEEERNHIIVAHDNASLGASLQLADALRTTGVIHKLNDLFFEHGMSVIEDFAVYGRVMVDGKFYDIPNTVLNICKKLGEHAPWAVTIHASGGRKMIEYAVQALWGTETKVLGVTVLTSFDKESCQEIYHKLPIEQVRDLAKIAHKAGAHGLVCSPKEVEELRSLYPHMILITPGVRSKGFAKGDQKRVTTPAKASADGADYVVIGRQITGADYPPTEVRKVREEINGVLPL
ncbi:MAG: orotidine-5'-phosphate decarboxylase [Candidatus Paceibacterota bacterium]